MLTDPPADLRRALDAAAPRLGAFAALRFAASIGSTNDAVMQLAAAGASEGASVLADEQTAGRGRRGNAWSSPAGAGLYLSVLLRGDALTAAPGRSTLGAGVAAAQAIATASGLRASLKWPNDLVIGDAWKKLGGILCEAHGRDALVVGIGINLTPAAHPPDVAARAVSIEGELGRAVDRDVLVVELLVALRELAHLIRDGRGAEVIAAWRALGAPDWRGAPVSWQDGAMTARAICRDIDDDGALVVERGDRRERVIAGEVVWERRP